jgi:20S proteasome alpha/beta subunit
VLNGLKSLSHGAGNDEEITSKNVEVSYVGPEGFHSLTEEQIAGYLDRLPNVDLCKLVRS